MAKYIDIYAETLKPAAARAAATPQTQPIPGRETEQIHNRAGGYTFKASELEQARRFLILGSPSTYYASEKEMTLENAAVIKRLVTGSTEGGLALVRLIESVNSASVDEDEDGETTLQAAAAARKDTSLFALAIAKVYGDRWVREAVHQAIRGRKVVSTMKQMYAFLHNIYMLTDGRMQWGSGFKRAVSHWLVGRGDAYADRWLAMQMAKYRGAGFKIAQVKPATSFTDRYYGIKPAKVKKRIHRIESRDVIRLAHPVAMLPQLGVSTASVFGWSVHRNKTLTGPEMLEKLRGVAGDSDALNYLMAFEEAQLTDNGRRVVELIHQYGLTWEMIPNEWFRDEKARDRADIWRALLGLTTAFSEPAYHADGNPKWTMPLQALLRNLPRLGAYGLLTEVGNRDVRDHIVRLLSDQKRVVSARVHPVRFLAALKGYALGRTVDANGVVRLQWSPNNGVLEALEAGFYAAFGSVSGSGRSIGYFLDVSGSMGSGKVVGLPNLTPREASAVMTMACARTESDYLVRGFTSGSLNASLSMANTALTPIDIGPRTSLQDAIRKVSAPPMGGTDCALPFMWALKERLSLDCFVILTDNESWAGRTHPSEAFKRYRNEINPEARCVFVAFTATSSKLTDPLEGAMLDVIGFDATAPTVIADFAAGRI